LVNCWQHFDDGAFSIVLAYLFSPMLEIVSSFSFLALLSPHQVNGYNREVSMRLGGGAAMTQRIWMFTPV